MHSTASAAKDHLAPTLSTGEGKKYGSKAEHTAQLSEPGSWKTPQSNHQINVCPQTLRASVALRLLCSDPTRADSKEFL